MKLLVTGGAGFIGSNFILYWLRAHPKDTIVTIDCLTYAGNLENLVSVSQSASHHFLKGNICDVRVVRRAMKDVDTVVHFAAETHVDRSIRQPSDFLQTNILGTHVVAMAALECGVKRFHHISTDEVFGSLSLHDSKKFSETTPYHPRSPYAASKAASDHLLRSYFVTYGLGLTITNCSNNFGPYQHPEKLIPLAITNILEGKKVPVYGDGRNVRDWLYVEDHCRAIERVLFDGVIGETYCVGGMTEGQSNVNVVRKILKYFKKDASWITFVPDRPGHDLKYALDWSKIHTTLGWEPKHTFDEWLDATIAWYVAHDTWWKKIKNKDFDAYYRAQYGA